jgi:RND family efflux transporter MFP subunit
MINRVKIGGKAEVIISALNSRSFPAYVKRISPQADEITGGFPIEIEVANKDNLIKAGMTATIKLLLTKEQKVLAVPEYAVVLKDNENYVYKITNDFAELIKIQLGESIGENIIVNDGLSSGDKIVIVGMKNLGTRTKVNIERLVD